MRIDKDGLSLGTREERELEGRIVDSLREANESGSFYEASMTNPNVGMEYAFPDFFGLFWCSRNVSRIEIIQNLAKVDLF